MTRTARKPFSNSTMRVPEHQKDKPHIALIDGFWRVSPTRQFRNSTLKARAIEQWARAYAYVSKRNDERGWEKLDKLMEKTR